MKLINRNVDIRAAASQPPALYPWSKLNTLHTIGVVHPCYGSSHVIYGLDLQRYEHRTLPTAPLKVLDRKPSHHASSRWGTFFEFTPLILDARVPLVHTWNAIPLTKNFIVSFELELPRYLGTPTPRQLAWAMKVLESERCKGILALSEFAAAHAERDFTSRGYAHLLSKLDVFRGAIRDPLDSLSDPIQAPTFSISGPLTGVVVGTQLFRKGGMYAVQAFEQLRAAGYDVRLTLIGDFESSSYPFGDATPDAAEWRARVAKHDWIRFEGPIPNRRVFEELRRHHVCIYPSLDESLGWLPIEAGMLGVPVLGNRIGAFPEFVRHKETGWLIDVPLGPHGRWEGIGMSGAQLDSALEAANCTIVQGIKDCVQFLFEDPAVLETWGSNGRNLMLSSYGIRSASQRLEKIYDQALQ